MLLVIEKVGWNYFPGSEPGYIGFCDGNYFKVVNGMGSVEPQVIHNSLIDIVPICKTQRELISIISKSYNVYRVNKSKTFKITEKKVN